MDAKTNSALIVLGGSIYLAFSFVAVGFVGFLGGGQNVEASLYLTAWGETSFIVILGVVMLVAGSVAASRNQSFVKAGGMIGALGSLVGAVDTLALFQTIYRVSSLGQSAAFSPVVSAFGPIAAVVALLIGFPAGMVGSFGTLSSEPAIEAQ